MIVRDDGFEVVFIHVSENSLLEFGGASLVLFPWPLSRSQQSHKPNSALPTLQANSERDA